MWKKMENEGVNLYRVSIFLGLLVLSFFLLYFPNTLLFFLLYSTVTQIHIHVYILFSPMTMLHHQRLDIIPSATQQDLIANPFQRQSSASMNPKLPLALKMQTSGNQAST